MNNKQTTLCFFNSTRAWGGGEKWHFDMATRLSRKGFRVIVFTNRQSELFFRLRETPVKVFPVRISNLSFLNPLKILKISKILKKEQVSAILLNLSADVKVAGLAAKKAGVKKIIYRRGLAKAIKNRLTNRFFFRKIITQVICNSEETKRKIFQENSRFIAPEKVQVIYNGIDRAEYAKRPTENLYERQGNEVVIGNAGRLVEQKGQWHLIEIARILKTKGLNFRLLIAGSGKLEAELKQRTREAGLQNEMIFLGFVENIKSFMQAIDIFVLTSYWEGFGYVLVEAMALEKPVVAWHTTSNPEVVNDGKSGFLVALGDEEKMAEKLQLLIQDSALRQKTGQQGKAEVAEKFDIERVVAQVCQLLAK